jgi:pimeloyl-ACP methyl ester carboxylesterase
VQPETRYARLGGDRIAYQVLGEGQPDLVMTTGSFGHVDMAWEDPGITLFLRTLATFSRLIQFDRRGTGASDPLPLYSLPPWESYAQDLTAVLDAVGSEQTALLAQLDACPMALFFAGTRPERTRALVLANATAKFQTADDYPIGALPRSPMRSWPSWTNPGAPRPWPRCSRLAEPATSAFAAGWPGSSTPSPAPGRSRRSCAPPSRWTHARSCP